MISGANGQSGSEAETIARLMHGCEVSEKTRRALSPEWGSLAEYVESLRPRDFTPEQTFRAVRGDYLASRAGMHPEAGAVAAEMEAHWQTLAGARPGDEPGERVGPGPFSLGLIDTATFLATEYRLEWLVNKILVARQPCVIGGPKKTLKTSVLIDLAVSLAMGMPFLGEFTVGRAVKVGFFSGESGPATIKDTLYRVCESKDFNPSVLENVSWSFRLPQLSLEEHLAELSREIAERRMEVVVIDPLYLCLLSGAGGRRLDASNLFDMGPLLASVTEACLEAGATPILVHHFRKNREAPYEVPELEDLAFAGVQEFARQWLLIGRREKFEPGSGVHRLWLSVGGSAGHSGDWALDVDEGVMGADFRGRKWDAAVRLASEARDEEGDRKRAALVEKDVQKSLTKDAARDREDDTLVSELISGLREEPGRRATMKRIRERTGWGADKALRVVARAMKTGTVRKATVTVMVGGARNQDYSGYQLVDDQEAVL
jgi:AAA domain-containing protein